MTSPAVPAVSLDKGTPQRRGRRRIDSVRPVAEVIRESADRVPATLADLAARYLAPSTAFIRDAAHLTRLN